MPAPRSLTSRFIKGFLSLALTFAAGESAAQVGCTPGKECIFIAAPECGVYNPELCKDPAERARYEKLAEEQRRKDKAAAEAREAERLRKEKEVADQMKSLNMGRQREAEAKRLLAMKAAADAARNKIKRDNCGIPEGNPNYRPQGWHGTACPQ
ncbi:hypothetical protein PQU92_17190 [Asticcacaulis sp. BYS171W]|uniref:DUF4124 domain-containing protein n=1 Tax=Asticcacaulis aquaticus TaxID=2984212 RepID=A0ABT5HYB7_9CAUL|nr:hypothetical protein [Asticcacaulis aquaticus]MDC7685023.1 hypothetical protein [Asticcacaulis aquaticus]